MADRQFPRFQVDYETIVMTKDGNFTGIIDNISMGGFYLRTNERLMMGENIQVDIALKNGRKNVNIITNATVVRIEENGIAFRFEMEGHYNYWTLHSYLNQIDA